MEHNATCAICRIYLRDLWLIKFKYIYNVKYICIHFPIQKFLNILSNISSTSIFPQILPRHYVAFLKYSH